MLIILRGNSGSGKTSTAYKLREKAIEIDSDKKIAVVEQDYLRRKVLKEKAMPNGDNIGLVYQTVKYAIDHNYDVILEGILGTNKYRAMLEELTRYADKYYAYYFDISFDETLRRHRTKPNAHEFGEKEMREWFKHEDFLEFENEEIISEELTQDLIISKILETTGL